MALSTMAYTACAAATAVPLRSASHFSTPNPQAPAAASSHGK